MVGASKWYGSYWDAFLSKLASFPSTQNGTKWKYQKKCSSERVKCLVFGYYTGTVTVIVTFLLSAPPADTPRADTPPPVRHQRGGVCLSACWDTPPRQTPPWADTPPPPAVNAADGTHPTGMHSCEVLFSLASFFLFHKFSNYKLMYFLLVTTDFNFCKFLFPNNFYL